MSVFPALGSEPLPEPDNSPAPGPRNPPSYLGAWLSEAVDGGVQIIDVVPGGPAERAGLEAGDIVFKANQQPIVLLSDINEVLWLLLPGDVLELAMIRSGETLTSRVRMRDRPRPRALGMFPRSSNSGNANMFGLEVAEITPSLREFYGAPVTAGLLVVRVQPGRLANRAGIKVGDVIVSMLEHPLQTSDDLSAHLSLDLPAKGLNVSLFRKGAQTQLFLASALDVAAIMKQDQLAQERIEKNFQIQELESQLEMLQRQAERIERILRELQGNAEESN